MAFATMHFATGMVCSAAAGVVVCTIMRQGWRWLPLVTTAGGFWAMVPDMPRLFREDFLRHLPVLNRLGDKSFEAWLHRNGDLFFFHHWLDTHRTEDRLALQGMAIIIAGYVLSVLLLMFLEWRARHSEANRFWQTHKPYLDRAAQAMQQNRTSGSQPDEGKSPTQAKAEFSNSTGQRV